jgi:hypothetical protein
VSGVSAEGPAAKAKCDNYGRRRYTGLPSVFFAWLKINGSGASTSIMYISFSVWRQACLNGAVEHALADFACGGDWAALPAHFLLTFRRRDGSRGTALDVTDLYAIPSRSRSAC